LARVVAIASPATRRRHIKRITPWLCWVTLKEMRDAPGSSWLAPREVCRHFGLPLHWARLVSEALKGLVEEEPGMRPIVVHGTVEGKTGRVFLVERVGLTIINGRDIPC